MGFLDFFVLSFVVVLIGNPLRQGFWERLCFDGFSGRVWILKTPRIAKVSDFFVGIGLDFWKDGGVLNMGVGFRS